MEHIIASIHQLSHMPDNNHNPNDSTNNVSMAICDCCPLDESHHKHHVTYYTYIANSQLYKIIVQNCRSIHTDVRPTSQL